MSLFGKDRPDPEEVNRLAALAQRISELSDIQLIMLALVYTQDGCTRPAPIDYELVGRTGLTWKEIDALDNYENPG